MYGTEPCYNEIPVITNTIQKPKLKICPDITNKCHHAPEIECETDQQRWKSSFILHSIVKDRTFSVNSSLYANRWHYSDILSGAT